MSLALAVHVSYPPASRDPGRIEPHPRPAGLDIASEFRCKECKSSIGRFEVARLLRTP